MENLNTTDTKEKLQSLLNKKKADFKANAPENIKRIYKEGLDFVKNSGILEKVLNVGDKAPDFTLKNQLKEPVRLYDELKKDPVILTWYRGGWCPYCNITLHYMQEKLPEFQNEGASLIALTPELPDNSLNTVEKHHIEFQVLSDVRQRVSRKYGVVYKLMDEVAENYQKSFDLHSYNGDQSNELPLAATYIIDQQGIIQYAFLDVDYRNRAEPAVIIDKLKELKIN